MILFSKNSISFNRCDDKTEAFEIYVFFLFLLLLFEKQSKYTHSYASRVIGFWHQFRNSGGIR